jgi:hypothetical protein
VDRQAGAGRDEHALGLPSLREGNDQSYEEQEWSQDRPCQAGCCRMHGGPQNGHQAEQDE